jgi:hypothetical protein
MEAALSKASNRMAFLFWVMMKSRRAHSSLEISASKCEGAELLFEPSPCYPFSKSTS